MTALAPVDDRPQQAQPKNLPAVVRSMQDQFALALPEHVTPERFVRVVVTAINSNPDLQKCDRESVLAAAMKCAQDGLLPDGKEAALVTYGNKAQYLPMIAGVLTKVRRSGELRSINAHVVYANDTFAYTLGDDEKIEHQPRLDGDRGKPIAAYAIAHTKDGGIYREIMSIDQVNQVRNVSRAKNNGPWVQWWDEMARKTVLRRLAKRLPMSTDLQQVFQRDDDHYDLRKASGAATLRRLHADFDEPAPAPAAITQQAEDAEVTDLPDSPTESTTASGGEEPNKTSPDGVPSLQERAAALQRTIAATKTVVALKSGWTSRDCTGLRSALDKADPDLLAECEAAFEARIEELEAAEPKEGGFQ